MKVTPLLTAVVGLSTVALPACDHARGDSKEHGHGEHHANQKVVVTSPLAKDITVTQQYVCQIRSQQSIEVRALQDGYLKAIKVREGQAVKKGDELFEVIPTLYEARYKAELAEAKVAQIEFEQTKKLFEYKNPVVSQTEVTLAQAKLEKAIAKRDLAKAELDFAVVRAPFDGIIDRLERQQGSLVEKKDVLTTMYDNSLMWVYFNVPEARYLEYMALPEKEKGGQIELVLANGTKFQHTGQIGAIEAKFNSETGNIPFRADFPNPNGLLRHGQTGNILIHRVLHDAVVIPQRATFEFLDKRYVYVVGDDRVAHQRLIAVRHEQDDIFLIAGGAIGLHEKIVLEGVKQVSEGLKLNEFEFKKPEEVLNNQKLAAE
jgi:membrane fusion protein (multidrug efflux system)